MKNVHIVNAWLDSDAGYKGIMRTMHMSTDGNNLFSYGLRIGETIEGNLGVPIKVVYDYTAKSGRFYSQTTSQHVGLAKQSYKATLATDWTDEKEKDNWNSVCCCHYS